MFERYTERARRVIFFARYEASQFGSTTIETEHLLLGLIREDKNLTNRFLRNHSSIESIRKEIEGRTTIREKVSTSIDLPLSNECKRILAYAAEEAERLNHRHIGTEHLLLGILREEKCVAAEILHERGLRLNAIREELARSVVDRQTLIKPKETPLLSEFSRDLTQAAMDGVLDPLVGRDAEIDRVIQILCRRTKNNPVLIGDPGVGKTAIVEGLAQRIVDGEVPSFLADKRILVLDLSLIVAGTKYRGQFEERLKTIMKELVDNPNTVVFIDELHTLVGAGSAEGSLDEASARVKLRQATLPSEMTDIQRRIKFIVARMESAISSKDFEKAEHYKNQEQLERENLRNVREKFNISETTSMGVVTKADIEDVVSRWTGVPVNSIKEEEMQRLSRIEEELHRRIVSQDQAINALARAIRRSRAGLKSPHRPAGSFLFLGPTGVGKTEMARSLAQFLFGSEKSLIRFDMSEFMEKHSVSKLIGSPPGYVGYEEGGQLTERVKRNPYSVILLDEIEKAHPDVYNILLQVFEDGQLTDGLGNTVDFKNTILIMTSNLCERHLETRQGMCFAPFSDSIPAKVEDLVMAEVKRAFNPEFLNRLDETILFTSLTDDDLLKIIHLLVEQININLVAKQIRIRLEPDAAKYILDKTCGDRSYGARPLRRALQKYIEDPLSEALIQGTLPRPAELVIYLSENGIYCRQIGDLEGQPVPAGGVEESSPSTVTPLYMF